RRTHLQAVVGVRLDDLFDLVRERVVGPAGAAGVPDEVVGAAPTAGAVPAGTVATTAPAARPVPAGAVVTAATGTARETGRADDAERAGGSQERPSGGARRVPLQVPTRVIFCHALSSRLRRH